MGDDQAERTFRFIRNGNAEPEALDWMKGAGTVRQAISESMNARNIAFLLGAGCSSLMKAGTEVGIPTMAPLAKEFCSETLAARATGFYSDPAGNTGERVDQGPAELVAEEVEDIWADDSQDSDTREPLDLAPKPAIEPESAPVSWRLTKAELEYLDTLGIDLEQGYNRNLERLMEVL